MKFRYSFQKIVDLKTGEKTQAEWVLSAAYCRLREEETSLSGLESEKQGVSEQICRIAENKTTVSELVLMQNYMNHIDRQIVNKSEDVNRALQNVAECQHELTAKMREEKVWFKARDKAMHEFRNAVLKREQETLDELATVRHKRPS